MTDTLTTSDEPGIINPSQAELAVKPDRPAKDVKRPVPATRREADDLYAPRARYAASRGDHLHVANRLGVLHPEGRPWTKGEVHDRILDAMYDEAGNLRLDTGDEVVVAQTTD